MKRYAVDLPDVEKQAAPNQGADFFWELGAPKTRAASLLYLGTGTIAPLPHHSLGVETIAREKLSCVTSKPSSHPSAS
jgi:hypothetical protein